MINEELYKLAAEHMTYDIPYSTQALIAELAYKLQAAEEDIKHSCKTCWYEHNGDIYGDACTKCYEDWLLTGENTNWKWRYYDEF